MTLHIVLFLRVSTMFLLINFTFAFEYLLCFVHGQRQRINEIEKKKYEKETGVSLYQLCAARVCSH